MSLSHFNFHLGQPHAELLRMEARHSDRSLDAHVRALLEERYDSLIRVCGCGHFIFATEEGRTCDTCHEPCCTRCATSSRGDTLCPTCVARERA